MFIHGKHFKTKKGDKIVVGYNKAKRQFVIHETLENGDERYMAFAPKLFEKTIKMGVLALARLEKSRSK